MSQETTEIDPSKQPLLAKVRSAGRAPRANSRSPEERRTRNQLTAKAQSLAMAGLRLEHPEEYRDLYEQAKRELGLTDD